MCIVYEDFEIENSWVDKLDAHDELTKITKRILMISIMMVNIKVQ
jgi:hypothetical protein